MLLAAGTVCFCFAEGPILHCWCWSFNTIRTAMPDIAAAGFTALQTSPINTCKIGEYGELNLMSNDNTGKWYYHYQPTDWQIGNYQLGTRDEFKAMCDEAKKYNIRVIVDVPPNHTTQNNKYSAKELEHLFSVVGGEDKLYHKNGLTMINNWGSRKQVVCYEIGGLPDVNTENPDFQAYFMQFMNDAIDCGAGGFRFDTAKHIALPDDPLDEASKENDFWPIFTGKKAIRGVTLHNADKLFLYGEVLQGDNARENEYVQYLAAVPASSYGGKLRMRLGFRTFPVEQMTSWDIPVSGDKLVTWVESHDTYANKGASAHLSNFQLRAGWALLGARKEGIPLFFSRPQGAEGMQFPGDTKIGDIGNDQFKHPEVAEINKFRTAMQGEDDRMFNGEKPSVLFIERGKKGLVIINLALDSAKISADVSIPDGKYVDRANKIKFTVAGGKITGKMKPEQIAVIY